MHSTAQPQRLSCMGQNSNIYELWKQWNFKLIIIRQKVEAYETSWAGLTIDPACETEKPVFICFAMRQKRIGMLCYRSSLRALTLF